MSWNRFRLEHDFRFRFGTRRVVPNSILPGHVFCLYNVPKCPKMCYGTHSFGTFSQLRSTRGTFQLILATARVLFLLIGGIVKIAFISFVNDFYFDIVQLHLVMKIYMPCLYRTMWSCELIRYCFEII